MTFKTLQTAGSRIRSCQRFFFNREIVLVLVVVVVLRSFLVVGLFGWVISPPFKTSKEIDDEDDHDHDHDDEEEDEHDDEVDALPPWEFMGVASQGGKTRVGDVIPYNCSTF